MSVCARRRDWKAHRALILLLGVALVVRVALLAATPDYRPVLDSRDFVRHAVSIAAGEGYPETLLAAEGTPTALRPPAYPYVLAGIYAASAGLRAARAVGALLGVLAVLLVYLVARELWDRRVALVAGWLAALFPPLALWQTALLSEVIFIPLELGFVATLLLARRSQARLRWLLAAGVLCGVAALARSNGLLLILPLLLAAWALRPQETLRGAVAGAAVPLLGVALVMAPWTIRNALAFDELVLTTTQAGLGLAGTYNDVARTDGPYRGAWLAPQFRGPYQDLFQQPGVDEAELDAQLRERGLEYLLSHPGYVFEATGLNALRMAGLAEARSEGSLQSGGNVIGAAFVRVATVATYVLVALAAAGAAVLTRRGGRRWGPLYVWLVPILMLLPALPIAGGARYRAPADPFLVMLATVALVTVTEVALSRRRARAEDVPIAPSAVRR